MQRKFSDSPIAAIGLFLLLLISLLLGLFLPTHQSNRIMHTYVTHSPYGNIVTTESTGSQNGVRYRIIMQSQTLDSQLSPAQQDAIKKYINQQQQQMQQVEDNIQQTIGTMPNLDILLSPDTQNDNH
jgi:hypothetical protein